MQVIFMGTPQFAVPSLKCLDTSKHEVISVVTQPDRPNKRGNKVTFSPIKTYALEHNIPVIQPHNIKEENAVKDISELKPDAIIVVAYGQLLPEELIELPKYGCINIHGSLLPKYRGSAPIHWSIINGEKETGITTMYMDVGMDTGDIIYKEVLTIDGDINVSMLHDILSEMGAQLLLKTLDDIEKECAPRILQDDAISTYAPLLTKDLGEINWNKLTSEQIHNLVRGTTPWPGAYTYYKGTKIKISKTALYDEDKIFSSKAIGSIIEYNIGKGLLVKTKDGAIYIQRIHVPNKKEMHVDEYLKGNTIEIDAILG